MQTYTKVRGLQVGIALSLLTLQLQIWKQGGALFPWGLVYHTISGLLGLIILVLIFMIPTWIARRRKHYRLAEVALINGSGTLIAQYGALMDGVMTKPNTMSYIMAIFVVGFVWSLVIAVGRANPPALPPPPLPVEAGDDSHVPETWR